MCLALVAMAGCFLPLASDESVPSLLGEEMGVSKCVPQGLAVAVDSKVLNYDSMSGDLYMSVHHGSNELDGIAKVDDEHD